MEFKSTVLQVKMTPSQREALRKEAEELGLNPSELACVKLCYPVSFLVADCGCCYAGYPGLRAWGGHRQSDADAGTKGTGAAAKDIGYPGATGAGSGEHA